MPDNESRLRTIASVVPGPGFRLRIIWTGGATAIVDMASMIAGGGVFGPLEDVALYDRVRVGARKRTIEWPQPSDDAGVPLIDIDADALAAMAAAARKPSGNENRRKTGPRAEPAPAKKHG